MRRLGPFLTVWTVALALAGPAMGQTYALTLTKPAGATYYRTDPVPIEGRLTYGGWDVAGVMVTIEILNPDGNLFLQTTATTNSTGGFLKAITIPINARIGTYTVIAHYLSARAQSAFVVASAALSIDPTSWTIGTYGYVQKGSGVPSKVFSLTNSAGSAHSATVTFPSFLSFGTNSSSGFPVNVPASSTVSLVVTSVDTSTSGDFSGNIVINSATGGVLYVPVLMKVRDTLAPSVQVSPTSWNHVTTRNVYTTQSFKVSNTGSQGVQVSVSESIARLTIMDSWASSFFLPPETSCTFRAEADTSLKGQILGNIVVQPTGLGTINIPVNVTVTNMPPTVHVDSPANGTTIVGTTTITISGSDPDGDPLTYHITLVNLTNLANRTVYAGSTHVWNTISSPEGWYYVIGNATDGDDAVSHQIKVRVVHNRPPTATTPTGSAIAGTHSFRVTTTVTDPDGDAVTATLYHRRQGTTTWSTRSMSGTAPGTYSATISSADYSVGSTVEFYVRAQDPKGGSVETSTSSYQIPNSPPIVGTLLISPSETAHSFSVSASVVDPEADTTTALLRHRLFGTFTWGIKSMAVGSGVASATISVADGYAPGVLIEVQIVASDPYSSSSSAIGSATLTNNPPQITNVQAVEGAGHSLEIRAQVSDPEGDSISSVKLYYKQAGGGFSAKNMTLSGGLYRATLSPADGLSVSANIQYKIVAVDQYTAEAESDLYQSQLGNAPPTIGQPTITDSANQHQFSVSFPVSDQDGDAVQSATLSHRVFGTVSWKTTTMSLVGGTASATITMAQGYLPIDVVEFKVEAVDQYGASSASPAYTHPIPNRGPSFSYINITSSADKHIAYITALASDPEGDSIVQMLLDHRLNGSQNWTVRTMNLSGAVASAAIGPADGYVPGQVIQFRLRVSDQYGGVGTSSIGTLSLPNRDPSATKPAYVTRTGHNLDISSTLADIEGDAMTATLQHRRSTADAWRESPMTIDGSTARYTLSTANGYLPKQSVQFRVLVRDAYGGQGYSEITETSLPNRPPVFLSLTLEDENGTHSFYAEVGAYDPDGDTLWTTCYFRKVNQTIWDSFFVAKRVKIPGELGAVYEVRFELYDGYDRVFTPTEVHQAPNSAPSIAISEPANGSILAGLVTISLMSSDPEGDRILFRILINGREVSSQQSYMWMTALDPDGWYNITATASDGFLSAKAIVIVLVDNTAVEIEVVSISKTFVRVGDELTVLAKLTDFAGVAVATVSLGGQVHPLLDDGSSRDGAPGDGLYGAIFSIPDIAEGTHSLLLSATDLAGNFVEVRPNIVVDRTDPVIHSITTSNNFTTKLQSRINVTVVASDNYGVASVSFGGTPLNHTEGDTWMGIFQLPSTEGRYEYEVMAQDVAGRNATAMSGAIVVDNTAPSILRTEILPALAKAGDVIQVLADSQDQLAGISSVVFLLVSNSSAETVHLTMELYDDGAHGDGLPRDSRYGNSFVLNATLGDGTYTCVIRSQDRSGNMADDRAAKLTVDNTPPTVQIQFPTKESSMAKGFWIRVVAQDANGINTTAVYLNGSLVQQEPLGQMLWRPNLAEIKGRADVTITCFDRLGHNTTVHIPLWVVSEDIVITGSGDVGDMQIFIASQAASIPVEIVPAEIVEEPSKENNYTAMVHLPKASGWSYSEIELYVNTTILFLSKANGERLASDQWWEEERDGKRIVCVTDLSPESYLIHFQPPPRKGLSLSALLKIGLAIVMVGLSYYVVKRPSIGLRMPRPSGRGVERLKVPRPVEEVPGVGKAPSLRRPEAVRISLPREGPSEPKPPEAPARIAQPSVAPITPPPTKPPEKPITPPRPPAQAPLPEKPYVPEKPMKIGPTQSFRSRLGKVFRRRRGGL